VPLTIRELSCYGSSMNVTRYRDLKKCRLPKACQLRFIRWLYSLERPQEIDNFLLFLRAQLIEMFDDLICLTARAPVGFDGLYQVGRPSIVEEENALSDAPQGSGSELVGACAAIPLFSKKPAKQLKNLLLRKCASGGTPVATGSTLEMRPLPPKTLSRRRIERTLP
jgi:hypothetical protein